jgi:hypothetical protein
LGLYTLDLAMSPSSIWPSEFLVGGMNDPSVYIHCCGGVFGVVLVVIFNWEGYVRDFFRWGCYLWGRFSMYWRI